MLGTGFKVPTLAGVQSNIHDATTVEPEHERRLSQIKLPSAEPLFVLARVDGESGPTAGSQRSHGGRVVPQQASRWLEAQPDQAIDDLDH